MADRGGKNSTPTGILKKPAAAAMTNTNYDDDMFAGLEAITEPTVVVQQPPKKRVRIAGAEKHAIKMNLKESPAIPQPAPQLNLFQQQIAEGLGIDELPDAVEDSRAMPPPPPVSVAGESTVIGTELVTQAAAREERRVQKQGVRQQKRARKNPAQTETQPTPPRFPHSSSNVNTVNFVPINEPVGLELATLAVPNQTKSSFSNDEYDKLLPGATTQTSVAGMARTGANVQLTNRSISAFINLLVSSNNQGASASQPLVFQPLSLGQGFASRYFSDKITGPPQRCLSASDQPNLLEMRSNSFALTRAHMMYLIKTPTVGREVPCAKKGDCAGKLLMNRYGESVAGEILAAAWFLHELPRFNKADDTFKEEMSHRMCILDWVLAALRVALTASICNTGMAVSTNAKLASPFHCLANKSGEFDIRTMFGPRQKFFNAFTGNLPILPLIGWTRHVETAPRCVKFINPGIPPYPMPDKWFDEQRQQGF
jgi:hypothetical protein